MDKMFLTVFTPSYNRAHLLPRLYESLCSQTNNNFIWLIIDDGSKDNTKELIEQWFKEKRINIQYHYKENGGMHTGHNMAYQLIKTELNICIDSDDAMPSDGVEKIQNLWESVEDRTRIAGIIGLDAEESGKIIGNKIPDNLKQGSLDELYEKYNVKGDKKLVLRTDIVHRYPAYPEYKGEKLVPLGVLYMMIGKDYDFIYSNDVYCIVEYQLEGSSHTILKQYKQSARGFAYSRMIEIKHSKSFSNSFKKYIHLVSSAIFAKDISLAFKGVNPLWSFIAFPYGLALNIYIRTKIK